MTNKKPLGDVAVITMGQSPSGSTYNEEGIGLPLLNGPTEFGASHPNCTLFTTDPKRTCETGDLIFCVRGSTTGRMNWSNRVYALGRGVCSFRGSSDLETRFVRYAIEAHLHELLQWSTGASTFPNLSKDDLHKFEVPWPPTRIQIAAILSAYDDLIENSTRRIAILEEMARRLYEEWFVHFRFPGHETAEFIECDGKSFPVGWQQKELKQVVKRLKNGTVYKQKDVLPSGSTIVVDQSRAEYLGFHDGTADHEASVASPIIIFGDHTCKMQIMIVPFSLGPNTIAFTSAEGQGLYYLFGLVQGNVETKEYKRHWTELSKKKVRVANVDLAVRYDETVRPIFAMMEMLRQKNRNLRAQRDLLLPKLISGEIDVSEAEAGLEAAE